MDDRSFDATMGDIFILSHSFIKSIPSWFLNKISLSLVKGFVKMSASQSLVGTNCRSIVSFWTWSLIKWFLISICFALECNAGFFERLMEIYYHSRWELYSHRCCSPQAGSLSKGVEHNNLQLTCIPASKLDNTVEPCFWHIHVTNFPPMKW